jgi:hypothetical protein
VAAPKVHIWPLPATSKEHEVTLADIRAKGARASVFREFNLHTARQAIEAGNLPLLHAAWSRLPSVVRHGPDQVVAMLRLAESYKQDISQVTAVLLMSCQRLDQPRLDRLLESALHLRYHLLARNVLQRGARMDARMAHAAAYEERDIALNELLIENEIAFDAECAEAIRFCRLGQGSQPADEALLTKLMLLQQSREMARQRGSRLKKVVGL